MKYASTLIAVIAIATFSMSSFAQGRHDEKPHGMTKPSATSGTKGGTGGRHDEGGTTHGKKKVTPKAEQPKSAEKADTK